jgi:hypothetical protein
MASGVYVSNVEDGNSAFYVVNDFEDLLETAPKLLTARCFNSNF